jgi:hypothetical protein
VVSFNKLKRVLKYSHRSAAEWFCGQRGRDTGRSGKVVTCHFSLQDENGGMLVLTELQGFTSEKTTVCIVLPRGKVSGHFVVFTRYHPTLFGTLEGRQEVTVITIVAQLCSYLQPILLTDVRTASVT